MQKLFRVNFSEYPRQFWLLFWGMLISFAGVSMIWPYLMIYVSARLELPMTATASLMTVNATAGLLATFIAGPITDRTGRKGIMIVGLMVTGVSYLAMIFADSMIEFVILMLVRGLANPLYRVGADAMIADIIPEGKRADAYALSRLSKNIGIAIGPAVGGFVASSSYNITFIVATIGLVAFGLITAFFLNETLDKNVIPEEIARSSQRAGFRTILKDRAFLVFIGAFTLTQICGAIMWVLLAVYGKENFNILESQYGFIPMTNALMVVALQIYITNATKKKPSLWMQSIGAIIYAIGVGSIAFGNSFWDFWVSIVVLTIGEMILVPMATTYVANLAPADMRGRYMSVFALTWGLATGIGPLVGGFLNDQISPQAIWYGAGIIGILGSLWFVNQALRANTIPVRAAQPPTR
ncbi:MAG: MFS transporter [Anaerolineales bacterium]|nr:MFS transporter [Chloroflexota bacterium]MBL6980763.1 MFS transporter [Anaerolineales bacterium]